MVPMSLKNADTIASDTASNDTRDVTVGSPTNLDTNVSNVDRTTYDVTNGDIKLDITNRDIVASGVGSSNTSIEISVIDDPSNASRIFVTNSINDNKRLGQQIDTSSTGVTDRKDTDATSSKIDDCRSVDDENGATSSNETKRYRVFTFFDGEVGCFKSVVPFVLGARCLYKSKYNVRKRKRTRELAKRRSRESVIIEDCDVDSSEIERDSQSEDNDSRDTESSCSESDDEYRLDIRVKRLNETSRKRARGSRINSFACCGAKRRKTYHRNYID